ncbi:MAG: DotD/TraH family lipoprotein, partial [Legionellales bacterium]|nr:DotD/TraH family lipoprotein [Legionellales bacterium]
MKKFIWIYVLLLTGCFNQRTVYTPPIDNSAEIQIAEAAESVSKSLVKLVSIQQSATPPIREKKFVNPDAWDMQSTASIDWSGPIAPLVKHIAKASSYKFRSLGKEPSVPIIITISSKNRP